MRFLVSRTSRGYKDKPCDDAFYVGRQLGDATPEWAVEINSLQELIDFYKKHGHEIIITDTANTDMAVLEIYDTYRE